MITFKPNAKEYEVEHVDDLIGGVDVITDPRQLTNIQAVDTSNVMFTNGGFRRSPGIVEYRSGDSFGTGNVVQAIAKNSFRWFQVIRLSGGATTKLRYSDAPGGAWTDVTSGGLTGSTDPWNFVKGKGLKATADTTGNTITAATTRTITTGTALTVNALVGKFVKITSGLGNGQTALITANTASQIFLEGVLDVVPLSTDTFSTFSTESVLYLGNSTNLKKIFYDNTSAPETIGGNSARTIEWHKNRLWGTTVGRIIFSNLGTGEYFGPDSFIEVGTYSNVPTIKKLGDRLVIYADDWRYDLYGDNPDNFQLVPRGEKTTQNASIGNGTNTQYFFSFQGLESLASVESLTVAESIPLSRNLMLMNTFGSYSMTEVYNNRVYVFSSSAQYGTSAIRCYIYDIEMSLQKGYPVWSHMELPKTVTAVWFEEFEARLYIALDGVVGYLDESITQNTVGNTVDNFTTTYTTGRRTQRDRERHKLYRKCRDVFNVSRSGTLKVYASIHGGTMTLYGTYAFTGTSTIVELETNTSLNLRGRDIAYKYEISWDGTAGIIENTSHDTYYSYLPKPL